MPTVLKSDGEYQAVLEGQREGWDMGGGVERQRWLSQTERLLLNYRVYFSLEQE